MSRATKKYKNVNVLKMFMSRATKTKNIQECKIFAIHMSRATKKSIKHNTFMI